MQHGVVQYRIFGLHFLSTFSVYLTSFWPSFFLVGSHLLILLEFLCILECFFLLASWKIFLVFFGFQHFYWDVSDCESLCFPTWSFLSFLDVQINVSNKFREFLATIFLNSFPAPLSFSSPSGFAIKHMLVHLIVSIFLCIAVLILFFSLFPWLHNLYQSIFKSLIQFKHTEFSTSVIVLFYLTICFLKLIFLLMLFRYCLDDIIIHSFTSLIMISLLLWTHLQ